MERREWRGLRKCRREKGRREQKKARREQKKRTEKGQRG